MLKKMLIAGLLVMTLIVSMIPGALAAKGVSLPDGYYDSPKTMYVYTENGGTLNVRSEPRVADGNVLGQLQYGQKVTAITKNSNLVSRFSLSAQEEDATPVDVTWTSSNAKVATVEADGDVELTGAAGTATITAVSMADSTKKATVKLTVTANATGLSAEETSQETSVELVVGKSITLKPIVHGETKQTKFVWEV